MNVTPPLGQPTQVNTTSFSNQLVSTEPENSAREPLLQIVEENREHRPLPPIPKKGQEQAQQTPPEVQGFKLKPDPSSSDSTEVPEAITSPPRPKESEAGSTPTSTNSHKSTAAITSGFAKAVVKSTMRNPDIILRRSKISSQGVRQDRGHVELPKFEAPEIREKIEKLEKVGLENLERPRKFEKLETSENLKTPERRLKVASFARTKNQVPLEKKAGYIQENARKDKLKNVYPILPIGVKIDKLGHLSGLHVVTHFAPESMEVRFRGRSISAVIQEIGTEAINHPHLSPKMHGGVLIVNAGVADLSRHHYKIPHPDGGANINGKTDSATIAQALQSFTNDENTTLVISSLLLQTTADVLTYSVNLNSGKDIHSDYMVVTGNRSKLYTILDENSARVTAHGLGATQFEISREGDDFKLTVTLDAYLIKKSDSVPMQENYSINVKFSTEIIIDGAQARQRVLALTMPYGISSEWSGDFDISLIN